MDINTKLSGTPPKALPFRVLRPIMMAAMNQTPFAGLIGTDPTVSPFVLQLMPQGSGFEDRWGAVMDPDEENVAIDLKPYETAIDRNEKAIEDARIYEIKWMSEENFVKLQKIGTPLEDPVQVMLRLAKRKFKKRFSLEIIKTITSGSRANGIEGRYDFTQNGQMPVKGRMIYGTKDDGEFTNYEPVGNMTFPQKVHADLNEDDGAGSANLSVKLARRLHMMATSEYPQAPLYPCSVARNGKFSEEQRFYAFVTPETAEFLENNDLDFKNQQFQLATRSAEQANPLVADRVVAHMSSITFIRCPELKKYAAFDQNGLNPNGPYHHNFLVGCDAVRILQSNLENGIQMSNNFGSHEAKKRQAVEVLYSYLKGYKCPAYFNQATGQINGQAGVNRWQLAEAGVIHFITKVA